MQQVIDDEPKVELGYRLVPSYWGQGLATEANVAIIHYAFTELGSKSLISIIDPANRRSLEAAKRIGMHYLKEAVFYGFSVQIFELDYKPT